jgi:hypothetical protein
MLYTFKVYSCRDTIPLGCRRLRCEIWSWLRGRRMGEWVGSKDTGSNISTHCRPEGMVDEFKGNLTRDVRPQVFFQDNDYGGKREICFLFM